MHLIDRSDIAVDPRRFDLASERRRQIGFSHLPLPLGSVDDENDRDRAEARPAS